MNRYCNPASSGRHNVNNVCRNPNRATRAATNSRRPIGSKTRTNDVCSSHRDESTNIVEPAENTCTTTHATKTHASTKLMYRAQCTRAGTDGEVTSAAESD